MVILVLTHSHHLVYAASYGSVAFIERAFRVINFVEVIDRIFLLDLLRFSESSTDCWIALSGMLLVRPDGT